MWGVILFIFFVSACFWCVAIATGGIWSYVLAIITSLFGLIGIFSETAGEKLLENAFLPEDARGDIDQPQTEERVDNIDESQAVAFEEEINEIDEPQTETPIEKVFTDPLPMTIYDFIEEIRIDEHIIRIVAKPIIAEAKSVRLIPDAGTDTADKYCTKKLNNEYKPWRDGMWIIRIITDRKEYHYDSRKNCIIKRLDDGRIREDDPFIEINTSPEYVENFDKKYKEFEEQERLEREKRKLENEKIEIARKLKEKERRRKVEKEVMQELVDKGEIMPAAGRAPIPREIVDAVYTRDGGKCVYCNSMKNLQIDHIIPYSKGGADTLENFQILCQKCNIGKSNKIG